MEAKGGMKVFLDARTPYEKNHPRSTGKRKRKIRKMSENQDPAAMEPDSKEPEEPRRSQQAALGGDPCCFLQE
jgi:hypothetical protein